MYTNQQLFNVANAANQGTALQANNALDGLQDINGFLYKLSKVVLSDTEDTDFRGYIFSEAYDNLKLDTVISSSDGYTYKQKLYAMKPMTDPYGTKVPDALIEEVLVGDTLVTFTYNLDVLSVTINNVHCYKVPFYNFVGENFREPNLTNQPPQVTNLIKTRLSLLNKISKELLGNTQKYIGL